MRKYLIFGCGEYGRAAYFKLSKYYKIKGFAENKEELWGKELFGLKIFNIWDAIYWCKEKDTGIIIAVKSYSKIEKQLQEQQVDTYIIWKEGLLYQYDENRNLCPVNIIDNQYYTKKNKKLMSILFVENNPNICNRTHIIAKLLKNKGVQISLAYLSLENEEHKKIDYLYEHLYPIFSFQKLLEFVNRSQFDLIHSSNESDFLTALLVNSNKPVIHDCHLLSSVCGNMSPDEITVEYVANVKSQGVIYTTEKIRDMACKIFAIDKSKTFVWGNFVSEGLQVENKIMDLISFYKKCKIVGEKENG